MFGTVSSWEVLSKRLVVCLMAIGAPFAGKATIHTPIPHQVSTTWTAHVRRIVSACGPWLLASVIIRTDDSSLRCGTVLSRPRPLHQNSNYGPFTRGAAPAERGALAGRQSRGFGRMQSVMQSSFFPAKPLLPLAPNDTLCFPVSLLTLQCQGKGCGPELVPPVGAQGPRQSIHSASYCR